MNKEDIQDWLTRYGIDINDIEILDALNFYITYPQYIQFKKNDYFIVNVKKEVDLQSRNIVNIPFKFGHIEGDFNISDNYISDVNFLPFYINGSFKAVYNHIENINVPIVKKNIQLGENHITSFQFNQNIIDGFLDLSRNKIQNIKGIPHVNDFIALNENELKDLSHFPMVDGDIFIQKNKITSLQGLPEKINASLIAYENELNDLRGCPSVIQGRADISKNPLMTLKGVAQSVYYLEVSAKFLEDLYYFPQFSQYIEFSDIESSPLLKYNIKNNPKFFDETNFYFWYSIHLKEKNIQDNKQIIQSITLNEKIKKITKL